MNTPTFDSPEALADWLESLHECHPDGAVTDQKWDAAQVAASAIRSMGQQAATLRQAPAQGGVTEAMVDGPALLQIARDVGLREAMFNVSAERATPLLQAFFAAALSAQQQGQGQGEVDACSCCGRTDALETRCTDCGEIQTVRTTAPPAHDMRDVVGGYFDQLQARIRDLEAQPAERVPEPPASPARVDGGEVDDEPPTCPICDQMKLSARCSACGYEDTRP